MALRKEEEKKEPHKTRWETVKRASLEGLKTIIIPNSDAFMMSPSKGGRTSVGDDR